MSRWTPLRSHGKKSHFRVRDTARTANSSLPSLSSIGELGQGVLVQIAIGLGMMEGMQRFVPVEERFKGRHFDQEIVVLNVRWYVTYKLS